MIEDKKKRLPADLQYPDFVVQCEELFQVYFVSEYKFLEDRQFKSDFALPCCKLAIEIQGGAFNKQGKGHKSVTNYLNDIQKNNLYVINGWKLLLFIPQLIENMEYLTTLRQFFYNNRCNHFAEHLCQKMLAKSE